MALDTPENRKILIVDNKLPDLEFDKYFCITSEKTAGYNCIAWAMGFSDRWVDPIPSDGTNLKKWWPDGVQRSFEPDSLINAFEAVGFECCTDDSPDYGYDKVALFKKEPFILWIDASSYIKLPVGWTHAAKVLSPVKYHSKMGPLFDIYHGSGNVLEPAYGQVYQFMRRRTKDRRIINQIIAEELGILIPEAIVEKISSKLAL